VASEDKSPHHLSVCNSSIWEVLGIWLARRTRCKRPETGAYLKRKFTYVIYLVTNFCDDTVTRT